MATTAKVRPPPADPPVPIVHQSSSPQSDAAQQIPDDGWTVVSRKKDFPACADSKSCTSDPSSSCGVGHKVSQGGGKMQIQTQRQQPSTRKEHQWTPWSQICKAGRKLAADCKLDFFAPEQSADGKIFANIPRP